MSPLVKHPMHTCLVPLSGAPGEKQAQSLCSASPPPSGAGLVPRWGSERGLLPDQGMRLCPPSAHCPSQTWHPSLQGLPCTAPEAAPRPSPASAGLRTEETALHLPVTKETKGSFESSLGHSLSTVSRGLLRRAGRSPEEEEMRPADLPARASLMHTQPSEKQDSRNQGVAKDEARAGTERARDKHEALKLPLFQPP